MQRADVYEQRYDESTQQTDANTCPECDGRVTMNVAETVCDDCGLVLADGGVDTGPEWRSFEDGPDRSRVGAPHTAARHDRGLSTQIGWMNEETSGRKRRRFSRLRREHRRTQRRSKRERNEMHGLVDIRRMTSALGFSTGFRDRACRLFSTAQAEDLLRGRSIEAIAAGSVYAACRCDGRPQTLDDVVAVARVDESTLRNAYSVLNRELGLPVPPVAPSTFLPRFRSALGFSGRVEQRAQALLKQEGTPETTGSTPAAVAAGAVLVATEEDSRYRQFTQAELAEVADVTARTVRRYRDELRALADTRRWSD